MRLRDLLYPEKVIGLAARAFFGLLALQLGGELLLEFLATCRLSNAQAMRLVAVFVALSPIVYLIRERRRRARPIRQISRRGAERKPVLPPHRDEE